MGKYLFPVAGVLAWSLVLAALSGFEAMDADREIKALDRASRATFRKMDTGNDRSLSRAESTPATRP